MAIAYVGLHKGGAKGGAKGGCKLSHPLVYHVVAQWKKQNKIKHVKPKGGHPMAPKYTTVQLTLLKRITVGQSHMSLLSGTLQYKENDSIPTNIFDFTKWLILFSILLSGVHSICQI